MCTFICVTFVKIEKICFFLFYRNDFMKNHFKHNFQFLFYAFFIKKCQQLPKTPKEKKTSSNVRWNVLVEVEAFYSAIDFVGAEEVYGFMPKKACNGLLIHPRQFFISLLTKTGMFGYSFKSFSRCVCWEVKLMIYETWNPVDFPKCHFCSWRFK